MRQVVKKHTFKNGLTLIVDEAPELKSVNLAAWVKVGSRHEDLENWGMCHFLEHMVFKGSAKKNASDIAKAVDRVGGDFNAFTSREHTCFYFYLPAREIQLGVQLLKEILFKPLFENKELERERQVILQEVAMVKESPEEDIFDSMMEHYFKNHSLGRQILGSVENIKAITREKIFRFFYQYYRPENVVIAVSGAVKFEQVKKYLHVFEGQWPNRSKKVRLKPQWGMSPPLEKEAGMAWRETDTEQAHLLWTLFAPVQSAKERIAAQILQQHLGGGMSSVLFDQIREKKGWAYTVYSQMLSFFDVSIFTTYAAVKPEKILETLEVIKKELNKIARHGIPSTDLKRIQDSLMNSFDLSLESTESRMMTIAYQELFYKREFSKNEYEKTLRAVKPKDISELVSKWLADTPAHIYIMSKKPKKVSWQDCKEASLSLTGMPLQRITSS